jgi:hypothetical protein
LCRPHVDLLLLKPNAQAEARATAPPTHELRKKPALWPVASSAS